jgi:hydrogenase-4 component B
MGLYGLLRMLSLLPDPPAVWGGIILFAGAVSGLLGVAFALAQHDLKRLLAYHSVENIGIILMGLGLAMLGRSYGKPEWIVLGMAGCLLHIWNHSFFKPLLFLGAGSVLHGTNTRQIDALGGLARRMPWTAGLFLVGAAAICGLPPLNGFISEFFVYMGLFRTVAVRGHIGSMAIVAAPVLAMIGALAVACFVKVYGTVFLGLPRSSATMHTREAPPSMIFPMVVLAGICLTIGLAPTLVAPVLERAIAAWQHPELSALPPPRLTDLVPLAAVGFMALGFLGIAGLLAIPFLSGRIQRKSAPTWDCGYAKPGPRMQYTASSFAQTLVGLFGWVLRPKVKGPQVHGAFPRDSAMESHVDEVMLDRALLPAFQSIRKWFSWFHRFQQGQTNYYVFYVLAALLIMLTTLIPLRTLVEGLFAL